MPRETATWRPDDDIEIAPDSDISSAADDDIEIVNNDADLLRAADDGRASRIEDSNNLAIESRSSSERQIDGMRRVLLSSFGLVAAAAAPGHPPFGP